MQKNPSEWTGDKECRLTPRASCASRLPSTGNPIGQLARWNLARTVHSPPAASAPRREVSHSLGGCNKDSQSTGSLLRQEGRPSHPIPRSTSKRRTTAHSDRRTLPRFLEVRETGPSDTDLLDGDCTKAEPGHHTPLATSTRSSITFLRDTRSALHSLPLLSSLLSLLTAWPRLQLWSFVGSCKVRW